MKDFLIMLVVLTNLRLLSTGRITSLIAWSAVQGVVLGIFALLSRIPHLSADIFLIAVGAVILKGYVFPRFLVHTTSIVGAKREVEPYVGPIASVLIGLVALIICLWLGTKIQIPGKGTSLLLVPATLFSVFTGQFLLLSRKMAISQVVGFLVMENGAFMMGVGTLYHTPFFVESGVLLDMFLAVLIMTVLIRDMDRAFHHIDTHELSRLKG